MADHREVAASSCDKHLEETSISSIWLRGHAGVGGAMGLEAEEYPRGW